MSGSSRRQLASFAESSRSTEAPARARAYCAGSVQALFAAALLLWPAVAWAQAERHCCPIFSSSHVFNAAENQTAVGTVVANPAGDDSAPTYAISGGADAAKFSIHSTAGTLAFKTAPNFEAPADADTDNRYVVKVVASSTDIDNRVWKNGQTITVTVTNVNEATTGVPTISGTARVGETLSVDVSGISDVDGLSNPGWFYNWLTEDGTAIADEKASTYTVGAGLVGFKLKARVGFTDDSGYTQTMLTAVTDTVVAASDPFRITSPNDGATVFAAENQTAVWTVRTAGASQAVTYSIVGGANSSAFNIGSSTGVLTFKTAPNREEVYDDYVVVVRASAGGSSLDRQIRVTLLDVDEFGPAFGSPATYTRAENATEVGVVSASDADYIDAGVSYTLVGGADQSKFSIDATSGRLRFTTAPDFENPTDTGANNTYVVTVRATSGSTGLLRWPWLNGTQDRVRTSDQTITVTVTDDDNPATGQPAITGTQQPGQTLTADITAVADLDGLSGATYSYQWIRVDGSTKWFQNLDLSSTWRYMHRYVGWVPGLVITESDITDATASTYALAVADWGMTLKVRVTFTDDEGHAQTVFSNETGRITSPYTAPHFTSPNSFTISENTTAAGTVVAADADLVDTEARYWIPDVTNAPDSAKFSIDATSGKLAFITAPDYESPTDTGSDNTYVVEVSAETRPAEELRDRAPKTQLINGIAHVRRQRSSQTITVTVTDANNPPTGMPTITGTKTVGQTLTAAPGDIGDPDGLSGVTYTYQWIRVDGETETDIPGATSATYTLAKEDWKKKLKVRVTFTDKEGHTQSVTKDMATESIGANDTAPTITSASAFTIDENTTVVTTVTATDTDLVDTPTFEVPSTGGGADGAKFSIGASDGKLTFKNAPDYESPEDVESTDPVNEEENNEYIVKVKVSSGTGARLKTATQTITVTVDDANDPATGKPSIGGTEQVGQALTVGDTENIQDQDGLPDPLVFNYLWFRVDGETDTEISTATAASYTALAADQGKKLKVRLTFVDSDGNTERVFSDATGTIAAAGGGGGDEGAEGDSIEGDEGSEGETVPTSPPDAVAAVRVVHNGTKLSVSWEAPAGATHYDLTYYNISTATNARAAWSRAGTTLDITCDIREGYRGQNCVNSTSTYTVSVRARNAAGESGWTNSEPVTALPAQVAAVRVTHNRTSLSVSWDAPARATHYDVTYWNQTTGTNARAAWNRAATNLTVEGSAALGLTITCDVREGHENQNCIDGSSTYTVSVRSRNAWGESGWTNSDAAAPPAEGRAWLVPSASDGSRVGVVRVVNRSDSAGMVTVVATDDSGRTAPPLALRLGAGAVAQFDSMDLELGNPSVGLVGATGAGTGDWRLALASESLDFEALPYVHVADGFVAPMRAIAPADEGGALRVATFNPASDIDQRSLLRLVNPSAVDALATVTGIDDLGHSPGAAVLLALAAGTACTMDASQLESGMGLACGASQPGLGDGVGKWRLTVSSTAPLVAMNLLTAPDGRLANLSAIPTPDATGTVQVPMFPSTANPTGHQGVLRVLNHTPHPGTVTITPTNQSGTPYPPLKLHLAPHAATNITTTDLEHGNPTKGLPTGTGPATGPWRLVLTSENLTFTTRTYTRDPYGFLLPSPTPNPSPAPP